MKIKELDICITTYNRWDKIKETLDILSKQTNMNFNLIINDDGSKDINFSSLPQVITKLILNKDDGYHRVGRFNESVSLCVSPNVVIMDDDCIPSNINFVQSYIDELKKHEVVRGIVRFPDGARAGGWFSTANLGLRLDLIKRIGLFDDCYDGYYGFEDHDLGNEYKKQGIIVVNGNENTLVNHGIEIYANGDRSDKILGHNRAEFIRKWGYDPTAGQKKNF